MKRLLLDPLRTGFTLLMGFLATLVGALIVIPLAWVRPSSRLIERVIHAWSRVWLWAGGVKLHVEGRELVDPTRSYVVVANHRSNFDIMAHFLALPIPIRFLAKKELFKIPLLARAMRGVGIIEVDRGAGVSIHEQVNRQAKQSIARGHSLIIYPEGTRSRSGEMGAFKKGAFTIAISLGLPVLPVTIQGTRAAWAPEAKTIHGGKARVVIGAPLETTGMNHSDIDPLRNQVRELISATYAELAASR